MILNLYQCFWLHLITFFLDLQSLLAAVYSYLQYFSVSLKVFLLSLLFLSPYLKKIFNGEYSNLACSTLLGLRPRPSLVKYSYLSKLEEHNANISAAFLSKSYFVSFCKIFLCKIFIWSFTVIFVRRKQIFTKS